MYSFMLPNHNFTANKIDITLGKAGHYTAIEKYKYTTGGSLYIKTRVPAQKNEMKVMRSRLSPGATNLCRKGNFAVSDDKILVQVYIRKPY